MNCDLIERAEADPDTVLTLVDEYHVVKESVPEIVDKVRAFRASVVLLAGRLEVPRRPASTLPRADSRPGQLDGPERVGGGQAGRRSAG